MAHSPSSRKRRQSQTPNRTDSKKCVNDCRTALAFCVPRPSKSSRTGPSHPATNSRTPYTRGSLRPDRDGPQNAAAPSSRRVDRGPILGTIERGGAVPGPPLRTRFGLGASRQVPPDCRRHGRAALCPSRSDGLPPAGARALRQVTGRGTRHERDGNSRAAGGDVRGVVRHTCGRNVRDARGAGGLLRPRGPGDAGAHRHGVPRVVDRCQALPRSRRPGTSSQRQAT